jgi:amino acid transporter
MSYVEVFATQHVSGGLGSLATPLNSIAVIYKVKFFKVPISLGAMVSFFSLSLSCLNAGARIIYPMGKHAVLPEHTGRSHHIHRTPHVAVSAFILIMFSVPTVLHIWSTPLATFDNAGTLAAFGFLTAYFLITIAAPVYLRKQNELKPKHIAVAVVGFLFLLVPLIGSFYPAPPWPVWTFPYIFLGYMCVGGLLLFVQSRRQPGILGEIEHDLETTPVDIMEAEPTVLDLTGQAAPNGVPAEAAPARQTI